MIHSGDKNNPAELEKTMTKNEINAAASHIALATTWASAGSFGKKHIDLLNDILAPVGLVCRRQANKAALLRRLEKLAAEVAALVAEPEPVVEVVVVEEAAPVSGVIELAPVEKAERAPLCLEIIKQRGMLTAHEAAKLLRLTGTFAPQAAVAALTSLVRRGLATKIHLTDGTATWRLPEAAALAA